NAIYNAWLKNGGTVFIPDGTYMINGRVTVQIFSNVTLKLSDKAILKAIPTTYDWSIVVQIRNSHNVKLIGGSIVGERNGHLGTTGEQGHGIGIYGSNDVYIADINVSDCWGDGINIGGTLKQNYSEKVIIERATINNNRRLGIGVQSIKNLIIRDGVISNTQGTAPQAGIDFEPSNPTHFMENAVAENVQTVNNAGCGIQIYMAYGGSINKADITIKNHTDTNSLKGAINNYGKNNYYQWISENCNINVI
ncbi:MAG: right-handed parallel beta-helix repeat-containing protein, partial [Candidatus Eremiobacterota bacterium]